MKRDILFALVIVISAAAFGSCNKDNTIELPQKPIITLDSETGVYKAKVGKAFTITPTVANGEGAVYRWLSDNRVIGTGPALTYTVNEAGSLYITFRVATEAGQDEKELRVDVGELAPPVISVAVPSGGLKVLAGETYTIKPDIQNSEGATFAWYEGEQMVSDRRDYEFVKDTPGSFELTLKAVNEDGEDEKTIPVEVLDEYPLTITFLAPRMGAPATDKSVFSGRSLYLRPIVEHVNNPTYSWSLEGEGVVADTPDYRFSKNTEGRYELTFTVTGTVPGGDADPGRNVVRSGRRSASVTLHITVFGSEESGMRVSAAPQKHFRKVYEYVPAPGQSVNDPDAGFAGESTMEAAALYAQRRMENNLTGSGTQYVSLGGFGGYVIVGFDHSIENKGGYDFSITGNQFPGSSEPGIVWVMQDTNGNGEPDDEWYELKGSEGDNPETTYGYAVTYFRPGGAKMNVQWKDNKGQSGTVNHLDADGLHRQAYYYPAWIADDSYTLYGTCLKSKTYFDEVKKLWVNGDYQWGYADNWGSDRLGESGNQEAEPNKVRFKISNAVYPDGTAANLKYIDFIKVQTGVNVQAGALGETSTEVFGFFDENMQ